jgi:hypothetical protein
MNINYAWHGTCVALWKSYTLIQITAKVHYVEYLVFILAHMINLFLCLIKHCSMKAHGSRGVASHILNLGSRLRQVVSFMPWLPYPWGNGPWYPLNRRLIGSQTCFGMLRIEPHFLSCPSHSLVTMDYINMINYKFKIYNSCAIRSCAVISSIKVLLLQGFNFINLC